MINKLRNNRIVSRFLELWEFKFFQLAVIINLIYLIISIVISIFSENVDFFVYYNVGKIFLANIEDIYNPLYYPPDLPFRYFPFSALFFIPYSFFSIELASILFNLMNFLLNIIISTILYKILVIINDTKERKKEEVIIKYINLFLIGFPQISNYVLGQINLYCCLFIILSLYVFLKHNSLTWEFLGSLILGISILIKPIAILLIPFLIIIGFNRQTKQFSFDIKRSGIRMIGAIIPLIINIIPFLIYPSLFQGFIEINLTSEYTVKPNFSISLTKIFTNFFLFYHIPFSQVVIFIMFLLLFGLIAIIMKMFIENEQNSIIISYLFGILIMFITYFDTWDHHLLILTPLLIITLFYLPQNSKISKKYIIPGFYGLNFLNLIFIGIWCITMVIFPYNFMGTIFLILIFIGVSLHCLNNHKLIERDMN